MSQRQPTGEQRAVITSDAKRLMVTASAGAGKTYVLVERYLRHVLEGGLNPDQILTITFTNKAAVEMKTRIVAALRSQGRSADAQIAETGPIQTIHSFCERMLRENSLAAGLDPSFEIVSAAHASRLLSECVRDELASDLSDSPCAEELRSFVTGDRSGKGPYHTMEQSIAKVLKDLRSFGWSPAEVEERYENPKVLQEFWMDLIRSELAPEARLELEDFSDLPLQEALFKITRRLRPVWLKSTDPRAEKEAAIHTCGLVQLALGAWRRLDSRYREIRALDFTGLEVRSVRLLEGSPSTRARLRAQYAVAMVDEFQDVNPIQHRIIGALGTDRSLWVGDDKQMIYGFRHADPARFQEALDSSETLKLSKNHRSVPGLLSFVDLVFSRIWSKNYERMQGDGSLDLDNVVSIDCSGVEIWKHRADDPELAYQFIGDLIREGKDPGLITVLVRSNQRASKVHSGLAALGIESEIVGGAERFYARMEIRDLANALRIIADPYDDFSMLACLRSPLCGLSLDAIAILGSQPNVADRLDEFTSELESDRNRLAAFLAWYRPLRSIGDRLSAWEALSRVFARSDYLAQLAARKDASQLLANTRKLLVLAASEPELGASEFALQIREIQLLDHREGDAVITSEAAKVVQIMTTHKAKGLEFDTVVLPDLGDKLSVQKADVLLDPREALVVTKFGLKPLIFQYLAHRKAQDEMAEERRVLYVAMTRARRQLCICLFAGKAEETHSRQIEKAMGSREPPGVRVRQSSDSPSV